MEVADIIWVFNIMHTSTASKLNINIIAKYGYLIQKY